MAGTAQLDAHLTAGRSSDVRLTGSAPLTASGALNLKLTGKLDAALANPLLEARGERAAGTLAVALTMTGTARSPEIGGTLQLDARGPARLCPGPASCRHQRSVDRGPGCAQNLESYRARTTGRAVNDRHDRRAAAEHPAGAAADGEQRPAPRQRPAHRESRRRSQGAGDPAPAPRRVWQDPAEPHGRSAFPTLCRRTLRSSMCAAPVRRRRRRPSTGWSSAWTFRCMPRGRCWCKGAG